MTTVSVIVNYFNPNQVERIHSMLDFVVESLSANTTLPLELIISDGSGFISHDLSKKCVERGWVYLHSDEKIGFSDAYNRGMKIAKGDYRVWMASDIILGMDWETRLISEMERTHAWMASPYLSSSDYPAQVYHWVAKMVTFQPSSMTFNLNMITAECYDKVGLMDEQFSGCFNDIDYLLRIRQSGGDAIIVDAGQILHVSRGTISESTMVDGNSDLTRFLLKYPALISPRAEWQYNYISSQLCKSRMYRQLIRCCNLLPNNRLVERISRLVMKFEPLFHRC